MAKVENSKGQYQTNDEYRPERRAENASATLGIVVEDKISQEGGIDSIGVDGSHKGHKRIDTGFFEKRELDALKLILNSKLLRLKKS